ncbi:SRPBCC family protein [Streptomyces sp. NPDC052020]|uniref:SRPBCC family protein n=1 Tax=Streptomyces sp. NPDC052020 TaxID=3155677 RepID=UPI00342AD3A5
MTQTLGPAGSEARPAAKDGPLADVVHSEAADRLKAEAREYLAVQARRLLAGVGRKLGETTVKLSEVAEGNSPGFARLALDGGRKLAEGKGPVRTVVELGASRAKDGVTGALKNLGGGAGRPPTVIVEHVDVGVPLRTAYDQWTRYQDFGTSASGAQSANRADETTSGRRLGVFRSLRGRQAKITERVPDDRISWTSEGATGTAKGVVSFHRLADSLTRVLLVAEYHPRGLLEKSGDLWRARGRRARRDLRNFARHVTLHGEAGDGRHGEIRDGEDVRTHEDAVAREPEDRDGDEEARQDRAETASGRQTGDEHDRYGEEEGYERAEVPYAEEGDVYEEPEEEEEDVYAYDDTGADADDGESEDACAYRDEDVYADRGSRR